MLVNILVTCFNPMREDNSSTQCRLPNVRLVAARGKDAVAYVTITWPSVICRTQFSLPFFSHKEHKCIFSQTSSKLKLKM